MENKPMSRSCRTCGFRFSAETGSVPAAIITPDTEEAPLCSRWKKPDDGNCEHGCAAWVKEPQAEKQGNLGL